jgi:hypothetical protein
MEFGRASQPDRRPFWRLQENFMKSTSDERITNNVMRHEYRILSAVEKIQMQEIKDKGLELHELIEAAGASRELSLAKTKVEESVMWAVKHLTK